MGRGRVELKRIENKISRQVTYSKRKLGLVKKAREISVLCEADVALIVFSPLGKIFQYSNPSSMERILERQENYACIEKQLVSAPDAEPQGMSCSIEQSKLKARVEVLRRNIMHYVGEELDPLSVRELQCLEQQLEVAIKRICTKKNQLMQDALCELQKKEKALQQQNNFFANKLKVQEEMMAAEQQNVPNLAPLTLGRPSPQLIPFLTIGGSSFEALNKENGSGEASESLAPYSVIPGWMLPHAN